MRSIKAKMRSLLAEVETKYDFSQFTMESFRSWIEQQRGKELNFVPWAMPPSMSGAWLSSDKSEYIFYEKNTPTIHQGHIQLHELAHILCGHPTIKVGAEKITMLFRQVIDGCVDQEDQSLLLRSAQSGEAEIEAEVLASFIQNKVIQNGRFQELLRKITEEGDSVDFLTTYIKTLEKHS